MCRSSGHGRRSRACVVTLFFWHAARGVGCDTVGFCMFDGRYVVRSTWCSERAVLSNARASLCPNCSTKVKEVSVLHCDPFYVCRDACLSVVIFVSMALVALQPYLLRWVDRSFCRWKWLLHRTRRVCTRGDLMHFGLWWSWRSGAWNSWKVSSK